MERNAHPDGGQLTTGKPHLTLILGGAGDEQTNELPFSSNHSANQEARLLNLQKHIERQRRMIEVKRRANLAQMRMFDNCMRILRDGAS